jgi:hypothetical protein
VKPSSLLELVTNLAACCTSELAFPNRPCTLTSCALTSHEHFSVTNSEMRIFFRRRTPQHRSSNELSLPHLELSLPHLTTKFTEVVIARISLPERDHLKPAYEDVRSITAGVSMRIRSLILQFAISANCSLLTSFSRKHRQPSW